MTLSLSHSAPSSPLTIADLIPLIQQDPTSSLQRKKVRIAEIAIVVRIIRRCRQDGITTAATIPCDVAFLNNCLYRLPPAAHALKKGSFENAVSGLRMALRLAALLDPALGAQIPAASPWTALLASIQDVHCRFGLSKFAAWCDTQGIAPTAVDDSTLAAFEAHVRIRHLRADIPGFISNVARSWRKAASLAPAWPAIGPKSPARREHYTLPFSAYPIVLQREIEVLTARLSGAGSRGPLGSGQDARFRPLRPRSVDARRYSLRQALTALVQGGRKPEAITSLQDLTTPEAVSEILMFYWERAVAARIGRGDLPAHGDPEPEAGNTAQTRAIGEVIMIVARYHCGLSQPELDHLAALVRRFRPDTQGTISPRNRALLDELCEPRKRKNLLHLPAKLMAMADAMPERPFRAGLLAMTAVAMEIELNKPLRLANLAQLKLGENLHFTDPRSGCPSLLTLPSCDVKNSFSIEWQLSPELGTFIRHYLRHHRPNLGPADSPWLFPSQTSSERPRCHDTIRAHIVDAVAEHVGVPIHVHLFRAFAGVLLLESNPNGLEDLRLLLDHKTLGTSLAYYAYRRPAEVARRFDQVLRNARAGISLDNGQIRKPIPTRRRRA